MKKNGEVATDQCKSLSDVLEEEFTKVHPCKELPPEYLAFKAKLHDHSEETETEVKEAKTEALVKELYKSIPPDRAALCLSGGGIRSATFSLGIIQGLARHNLLNQFHYLSTVSGGGYIGGWLSAWMNRSSDGFEGVIDAIQTKVTNPLQPEVHPIRHLRTYSNFLTPKIGLLSSDTWTLLFTYLRNLILNWLLLIPFMGAVLMLPRILVKIIDEKPWFIAPVALPLGCVSGFLGLAYISLILPTMSKSLKPHVKAWIKRFDGQGAFLTFCLLPLAISSICLTSYWAWNHNSTDGMHWWTYSAFGGAMYLVSWLPYFSLRKWSRGEILQDCLGVVSIVIVGIVAGLGMYLLGEEIDIFKNGDALDVALIASYGPPVLLLTVLLAGVLMIGIASRKTTDDDREWFGKSGGWVLLVCLSWAGLSGLVVFGPNIIMELIGPSGWLASKGGGSWAVGLTAIITFIMGLVSALTGASSKTSAGANASEESHSFLAAINLRAVAPLFAILLVILLSWLTSELIYLLHGDGKELSRDRPHLSLEVSPVCVEKSQKEIVHGCPDLSTHTKILKNTSLTTLIALMFALIGVSVFASKRVNINKFSMHTLYRDRLIRTYLGASRPSAARDPVGLTGLDSNDNIQMHTLRTPKFGGKPRLFHIVNTALNLVNGKNLAWQERKAESFTISSLHVGSHRLGYRDSKQYGQDPHTKQSITLGTAMAISGAAASPNMGYSSSPGLTFLMTLFNVRLGWWLGNPGEGGEAEVCRSSSPRTALRPILDEAFGLTNDKNPYVYLSDGGHFENLGLYEMVLRRCRFIVVIDAGQDEKCAFEDLGNAVRKIRIDFGVRIELKKMNIYPRTINLKPDEFPKYCAVGEILYEQLGEVENGWLVYIKPALIENECEPVDIANYAKQNPAFPHEPTFPDQWFSESQFESYRMLGSHIIERLVSTPKRANRGNSPPLQVFREQIQDYLGAEAASMEPPV